MYLLYIVYYIPDFAIFENIYKNSKIIYVTNETPSLCSRISLSQSIRIYIYIYMCCQRLLVLFVALVLAADRSWPMKDNSRDPGAGGYRRARVWYCGIYIWWGLENRIKSKRKICCSGPDMQQMLFFGSSHYILLCFICRATCTRRLLRDCLFCRCCGVRYNQPMTHVPPHDDACTISIKLHYYIVYI